MKIFWERSSRRRSFWH